MPASRRLATLSVTSQDLSPKGLSLPRIQKCKSEENPFLSPRINLSIHYKHPSLQTCNLKADKSTRLDLNCTERHLVVPTSVSTTILDPSYALGCSTLSLLTWVQPQLPFHWPRHPEPRGCSRWVPTPTTSHTVGAQFLPVVSACERSDKGKT